MWHSVSGGRKDSIFFEFVVVLKYRSIEDIASSLVTGLLIGLHFRLKYEGNPTKGVALVCMDRSLSRGTLF